MKMISQLSIFLCVCTTVVVSASLQSVAVEGILTCNGKPYKDAKVKLYDHDTFTPDDKLAETKTDSNGRFKVTGTGNEISTLNPKFFLYHKCNQRVPVCYYKSSFAIPQQFVTLGVTPKQTFNAQTIELSLLKKERDCVN